MELGLKTINQSANLPRTINGNKLGLIEKVNQ